VLVGGGLGRTPIIGSVISEFLPWPQLLSYLDAILRVYNRYGRRDNKYKARIKILVKELTPTSSARRGAEWATSRIRPVPPLTEAELARIGHSSLHRSTALDDDAPCIGTGQALAREPGLRRWVQRNVTGHKGRVRRVTLSLKRTGVPPGDATAEQMERVADLADATASARCASRTNRTWCLPMCPAAELYACGRKHRAGLATPNIGLLTDIICCPRGDFCSLANAKSIPVAEAIQRRFDDLDYLHDIGELDLNISGCMNACGHHHVGHIGILGVDKKGRSSTRFDGHAEPQDFADALGIVRLIAIHFPVFSDGRGYSLARILREQMGYKGELRAIGDVLRDQLFLMRRCGFDSFEMRADRNAADALPGLTDFSFAYQRAVVDPSVPLVMRETLPAR
jgi:sulfite reductase (NADPH) hemoprotein beta-component